MASLGASLFRRLAVSMQTIAPAGDMSTNVLMARYVDERPGGAICR
jgi:hypothetical protein